MRQRPDAVYTFASHGWSHAVSFQTARTDLLDLARFKLLQRSKKGRKFYFTPVPNIRKHLESEVDAKPQPVAK